MRWTAAVMLAMALLLGAACAETIGIADADALRALALRVAAGDDLSGVQVVLTADVGPVGRLPVPIGTCATPFEGSFDGMGHVLFGAVVDGGSPCEGVFGCVGRTGSVRNLRLEKCLIFGVRYTGALCGLSAGPVIGCAASDCLVLGRSGSEPNAGTGGLVGCLSARMEACRGAGLRVWGSRCSGGLAGQLWRSGVARCAFLGGSVGGVEAVGGLAGSVHSDSRICGCLFSGALDEDAGPLCGQAQHAILCANVYSSSFRPAMQSMAPGSALLRGNVPFSSRRGAVLLPAEG